MVDGQGGDIAGLTLVLDDVSGLLERELGRVEKTTSGSFTLNYPADNSELGRRLRLRIRSATTSSRRSRRTTSRLPSSATRSRSRAAWRRPSVLATLGTGSPSRVRRWERDRVARRQHRRVGPDGRADRARGHDGRGERAPHHALQIDVGPFSATPSGEKPELVLKFDPESMTLPNGTVRELTNLDARIEHLILDAFETRRHRAPPAPTAPTVDKTALAAFGLTVGLGLGLLLGLGLILLAVGAVASLVAFSGPRVCDRRRPRRARLGALGHTSRHLEELANEVSEWFSDAQAQGVSVRILKSEPYSLTHTKIVTDGKAAVLHGSPFEQVYFDGPGHVIDDFRREATPARGPSTR